jgi:cytochrome c-type biogenesis protein CcmH
MTAFIALGALLLAGALLFVVPPLLRREARPGATRDAVNVAVYRDQLRELEADLRSGVLDADQHERARSEIEARLLADMGGDAPAKSPPRSRATALALGLFVPACALAVYLAVGNPRALAPEARQDLAQHGVSPEQFEALVARLAARLKENPEDAEGWAMLGRSYAVLGRFSESADAYAEAAARTPRDAQLLTDWADALAMAQGRTLEGEPEKILARALAIEPLNIKALMLAGTAAFNRKDYRGAVRFWERILGAVPSDSEIADRVRASVAEARTLGALPQAAASTKSAGAASTKSAAVASTKNAGRVTGVVRISPDLAAKVEPGDTVFIFARAEQGPRMPLAILRKQGRDLPIEFTLDDSMAMSPAAKLSDHPRVVIGVRVSKTANANPQPGDLQGLSAPVKTGAGRVSVTIDSEVRGP